MNKSKKEIYDKVLEITKNTPGGVEFFDKLDGEIIDNASDEVMKDLFALVPEGNFLVLSGGFGKKTAKGIDEGKFPKIPYFLFKGGIRSGAEPEIIRGSTFSEIKKFIPMKGTFLDDSIYGGATYYKLKELFQSDSDLKLENCAVIYDGCPIVKDDVKSIFRYYDHFEAKPNYKF
jgi:hypothetical protein